MNNHQEMGDIGLQKLLSEGYNEINPMRRKFDPVDITEEFFAECSSEFLNFYKISILVNRTCFFSCDVFILVISI